MSGWKEKCRLYFKANDCIASVESWTELISFLLAYLSLCKLVSWALPSWWLLAGSAVAIYVPFWLVKKIACSTYSRGSSRRSIRRYLRMSGLNNALPPPASTVHNPRSLIKVLR